MPPTPVHPRVCGELRAPATRSSSTSGSSPRVRGTRAHEHQERRLVRFIPACAGNSSPSGSRPTAGTVHPRVCGELGLAGVGDGFVDGSSPRVRGTHRRRTPQATCRRFIPACAGNSCPNASANCPRPVHPRVCGELVANLAIPDCMRRFIPACAGNSHHHGRRWWRWPVHPRVCGELYAAGTSTSRAAGSSPRVRGTRCARSPS